MRNLVSLIVVIVLAAPGVALADPGPSYHCETALSPVQTTETEVCTVTLGPGEHHVELTAASLISGSFTAEVMSDSGLQVWSVTCSIETNGVPSIDRHEDCETIHEGTTSTSWTDLEVVDQHTADFNLTSSGGALTLRAGPGDGILALTGD